MKKQDAAQRSHTWRITVRSLQMVRASVAAAFVFVRALIGARSMKPDPVVRVGTGDRPAPQGLPISSKNP